MRNPVRTEAEAFSFVIAVVALFAAVALVGILLNGWAALVAFVVLAPIVGYRYFRSDPTAKRTQQRMWRLSRLRRSTRTAASATSSGSTS